MKNTMIRNGTVLIVSLFLCVNIFAQVLDKRIDLSCKNERLTDILKTIEERASVEFSYNSKLIPKEYTVSVSATNKNLDDILQSLLSDIQLSYKDLNEQIIIFRPNVTPKIQSNVTVPVREKVYIYDTIRELIVDTITLYNFDTIVYKDTVLQFDTIKVYQSIKEHRFFLGASFSPSIVSLNSSEILSSSDHHKEIEEAWKTESYFFGGVDFSFKYKNLITSIAFEYSRLAETLDYSREAILQTKSKYEYTTYTDLKILDRIETKYLPVNYKKIDPYTGDTIIENAVDRVSVKVADTVYYQVTDSLEKTIVDTIYPAVDYNLKRRISYVSIPLTIGYAYTYSKWTFDVSGGIVMSRLLVYNEENQGSSVYAISDDLSKYVYSALGNISVGYYISNKFKITAGIRLQKQLNSMYRGSFPVDRRIRSTQLSLGLKYVICG